MRVKPNFRKETIEGIQDVMKEINDEVEGYLKSMASAQTVEGIMIQKRNILACLIRKLPLHSTECYFCNLHYRDSDGKLDCKQCEYGKVHGICGSSFHKSGSHKKMPTWDKIITARDRLKDLIQGTYYAGGFYK